MKTRKIEVEPVHVGGFAALCCLEEAREVEPVT